MGWKIAAFATPTTGLPLAALVARLYDGATLQPADKTVDAILHRDDAPRATTVSGHHWLFDWSRVQTWLQTPPTSDRDWLAITLHSTVDVYGFSIHSPGHSPRIRLGSAKMGIVADIGGLLELERDAIRRLGEGDLTEDMIAAWRDAGTSALFPASRGRLGHAGMAEDVVLHLISSLTSLDMDTFLSAPVHAFGPPARKSVISRLLGRTT